mgnify:CR=1 FL=1
MAQDLFDLDDIETLIRHLLRREKEVDLRDFDVSPFVVSPDMSVKDFRFHPERYKKEVKRATEYVISSIEGSGYNVYTVFTPLYEAILNAFQHGHGGDPSKLVTIAHKVSPEEADIAVIDEGGVIDSEFVPFVLRHREGRHRNQVMDFYEFAGRERPDTGNLGKGTFLMHSYANNISYYKSENGGLVVQLVHQNPERVEE